jgi:serine phosphatase RsbU (regulator of sigma subunit)
MEQSSIANNQDLTSAFEPEVSIKRLSRVLKNYLDANKNRSTEEILRESLPPAIQSKIQIDSSFWITSKMEEGIYSQMKGGFSVNDSIYLSGREFLLNESYDLLPADDTLLSYRDFLLRIPIAISKYLLYFRLKVIQINEKSVVYSIHSEEGSTEKIYDFCFLKGIFEGTIMLFQIKNWKLIVDKTINSEVDGKYIESAGELNANESLIRMEWEDSTIQVGKSALNASLPPRVSQTFVISQTDSKENVEFSYIDLNAVINKSKELVIENRDLEAAVEVLNSLRDEMIVKHKAISKDLRMARNIQRGIIPQHIPDWKGLQFDFSYLPMQEVSGDYYDYFNFGSNKIGIMLSDVSGHGVPAAFITAISKLLFTNYKLDSPAEIFSNANRELIDLVKQQGYLTCFYGIIDSVYELKYCIAGHPRPILLRYATGEIEILEGEGTFLGMFEDADKYFKDYKIKLEPGDKLFIYTDGLLEGENDRGEQFQQEILIDLIKKTLNMKVNDAIDFIMKNFKEFCRGTDQGDDITILAMGVSLHMAEFQKYKTIAEKYYGEKLYHLACDYMYKAKEIFPTDVNVLFQLGKYLAKEKQYLDSSKHLEEYNSLKTSNADSHLILGYCYYKLENFGKAEMEFVRAMSMRTGNITAMFNLSKVYQKQKEFEKAIEILQKILTFDPNHTQSKKSIHNLVKMLERRKNIIEKSNS